MEKPKKPKKSLTKFSGLTRDAKIELLIRMDEETRESMCENVSEFKGLCDTPDFWYQKLLYLASEKDIPEKELYRIFQLYPVKPAHPDQNYEFAISYFDIRDPDFESRKLKSWRLLFLDLPLEGDDSIFYGLVAVDQDKRTTLQSFLKRNLDIAVVYFFYLRNGKAATVELLDSIPFSLPISDGEDNELVVEYSNPLFNAMLKDPKFEKELRQKRGDVILSAFESGDHSIEREHHLALLKPFMKISGEEKTTAKEVKTRRKREEEEEDEDEEEEDSMKRRKPKSKADEDEESSEEEGGFDTVIVKGFLHQDLSEEDVNHLLEEEENYAGYFILRDNLRNIIDGFTGELLGRLFSLFYFARPEWKSTETILARLQTYDDFRKATTPTNHPRIVDWISERAKEVLSNKEYQDLVLSMWRDDSKRIFFLERMTNEERDEIEKIEKEIHKGKPAGKKLAKKKAVAKKKESD